MQRSIISLIFIILFFTFCHEEKGIYTTINLEKAISTTSWDINIFSGYPFVLNERKTIYVNAGFVSENNLYCIVPIEELPDVVPDLKNDDNPFII
jgi:hypothetical protein